MNSLTHTQQRKNDLCTHFRLTDAKHKSSPRSRKKPNGDPRKLVGREKCSRLYWSGHDSRDRKQRSIQTKNTHLDVRNSREIDLKAFFNIPCNTVENIAFSPPIIRVLPLTMFTEMLKIRQIMRGEANTRIQFYRANVPRCFLSQE